jgi:hypothetical protein
MSEKKETKSKTTDETPGNDRLKKSSGLTSGGEVVEIGTIKCIIPI